MRSWSTYLLVGAVLSFGAVMVQDPWLSTALYQAVVFSAPAAVWWASRRSSGVNRTGWLLVAAGELSSSLGDATYNVLQLVLDRQPAPSVADAFYLLAYPLLGAGLVVLTGRGPIRWAGRLEVAIVTLSLALPLWVFVASPVLDDATRSGLEKFCDVTYPVGDLLLLALLVRLVSVRGLGSPSVRLLVIGASLLPLADALFSVVGDAGWLGQLSVVCWSAAALAWGAAALHPRSATVSDDVVRRSSRIPLSRTAFLAGAALVAPALTCAEAAGFLGSHLWAIGLVSLAVVVLGALRMHLSVVQTVRSLRDGARLRDEVAFHASHDPLTGLVNRARTVDLVATAVQRCQSADVELCLVSVHLDDLATVNSVYGEPAGDHVLRAVAREAVVAAGSAERVGRLSGDEFAIWFEGLDDPDEMSRVTGLLTELPVHLPSAATWITVTCSVGVTVLAPGRGVLPAAELLRESAAAAGRAKGDGGGCARVFDDGLRTELTRRVDLDAGLRTALELGQFELHYQPVVDLSRDVVSSFEALIRWHRPGHGLVPPDEFVPVAEASDLICGIGRWVLAEATRQLAAWRREGVVGDDVRVAVNLSGRHLAQPTVVADVQSVLAASGLPASALVLEATETVVLDRGSIHTNLRRLRLLGVGLSLDDFGTGYTSIQQFRTLPMDTLKIDKSFLAVSGEEADALVGLLIHSAHAFGLRVIAEGVERPEQVRLLRSLGCDAVQGYLFSRPVPAREVSTTVRSATTALQAS